MGIQKDKLSEDQKKEIERLRNFVARNRLEARMNGTRWRAAIDAILGVPGYRASFRIKRVTDAAEPPGLWEGDFPGGIPLYNSIEWLELNPRAPAAPAPPRRGGGADFGQAIREGLAAAKIPFEENRGAIRIVGYVRKDRT